MFRVGEIWYNSAVGAIFCQVRRIMPDESEIPCVTSGTQKWNGARPNFMASARVIKIEAVELDIWKRVHWLVIQALWIMANMTTIEAVACVRKYLIAASVDRGWLG